MSELRGTLETHPNILQVHFDNEGNHYFVVHERDGAKFGKFLNGFPIISSRITETKTREEVLGLRRNFDTTDKQNYVEERIQHKGQGKKSRNS